jgi:hypothetical protein
VGSSLPRADTDPDAAVRAELATRIATVSGFLKLLTEVIAFGATAKAQPVLAATQALPCLLDGRRTRRPTVADVDPADVDLAAYQATYDTASTRAALERLTLAYWRAQRWPPLSDNPGFLGEPVTRSAPRSGRFHIGNSHRPPVNLRTSLKDSRGGSAGLRRAEREGAVVESGAR